MKTKTKQAVNVAHVALFNAACIAASGMATACESLARALIGKGRGKDDYVNGIKALSALEAASVDGNRHTVRRYTAEALAILAQVGRKAKVPTVAAERTDKAQQARKALGIKKRGVKAKKAAKPAKPAPLPNFEDTFRAMLRLAAGRATIVAMAKREGWDIAFSMRAETASVSVPSDAPKPTTKKALKAAALVASADKAAAKQSKANGATH